MAVLHARHPKSQTCDSGVNARYAALSRIGGIWPLDSP
jgi:hypothetical protein